MRGITGGICRLLHLTCSDENFTNGAQVDLVDYGMNSVSQGIDAMAITRVVIRPVDQPKQGVTPQVNLTPCICIIQRSHSKNSFHVKQRACKHQCALCPIPLLSACYFDTLQCLAVTITKRATDTELGV